MNSAYSSVLEQSNNFKCSMKQETQQLYNWKLKLTHFNKYLVSSKTIAMLQHQKQLSIAIMSSFYSIVFWLSANLFLVR